MKKRIEPTQIKVPTQTNKLLTQLLEKVNQNPEIFALWKVININAIDRLGMSDHGPVHFQIVANIALRFARILKKHAVKMSLTKDFGLSYDHAELVIFLASIFHDLGMSISRKNHEEFSLILANNLLHEVLDFLPVTERTIITSETLHAIISHREGGTPYTIEAGIVRVADALDMSEGRSRMPYQAGEVGIHSISAAAVDSVAIQEGRERPLEVTIEMNNSAGIFQVDELLKNKIKGSGLEKFIAVKAYVKKGREKKLIGKVVTL